MMILAIGSVFGGLGLKFLGNIDAWLEPVVGHGESEHSISNAVLIPITLAVVAAGASYAWITYGRRPVPVVAPAEVSLLTRAARNDAYGDAINEAVFMRPGLHLTRALVWFDSKGIDGFINALAGLIAGLSAQGRKLQNGYTRTYALTMLAGAALIAFVLYLVRL
jgi:NADH-quinone oxidoreductase subunit L